MTPFKGLSYMPLQKNDRSNDRSSRPDSSSSDSSGNDDPYPDTVSPLHEFEFSGISSSRFDPHSDPLNSEIDEMNSSSDES